MARTSTTADAKPKTVAVTVRVPTSLHRKIKALADKESRSVNNWMAHNIEQYIIRNKL